MSGRPTTVPPFERPLVDGELTVRPFVAADRDALIAGRDAAFRRFLAEASAEPAPMACLSVGGTVVGWIDADADDRHWLADDEVNVGYNVFPDHRGRGYGTRALRLLSHWLRAQDPPRVPTLLIDPDNEPSLAVAGRAGFHAVAEVDGERLFKPAVGGT
ncbi:MAG: GNAT family N-acetyltransferase [Actinomycetota bacterium]